MVNITIPQVLLVSIVGMAVVFAVLIILMAFIKVLSLILKLSSKKTSEKTIINDIEKKEPARGSCGEVAVFDVPDKIAAMAMAIVADKTQIPLNELRFISIKEVEENK